FIACGPKIRDGVTDIPEAGGKLAVRILRGRAHALEQPLERSRRRHLQVGRNDLAFLDAALVPGERNLSRNILDKIFLARKDELYRRSAHLIGDLGEDTDVLE